MREAFQAGDVIGDGYTVVRLLETNDLTRDYLARVGTQRYVVRELVPPVEHDRQLQRIVAHAVRHVKAVERLSHPGLPRLHGSFVWEDRFYLTREYSEDPSLIEVLQNMRQPAPEELACNWTDQLIQIFAFLHDQQPPIVLAGVSPELIAISRTGKAYLRDYPMHYFLPPEHQWKHAKRLAAGYIAPEQVRGDDPAPQCDVYNLGQILFYMLTRRDVAVTPYSRNEIVKMRPDLTRTTLQALESITQKHPNDRPQSATVLQLTMTDLTQNTVDPRGDLLLDTPDFCFEDVRRGETLKGELQMHSVSGRVIHGRIHCEDWIHFKFNAFRGADLAIPFSIYTQNLVPGRRYKTRMRVDTDAGIDEAFLEIEMAPSLGDRLTRQLRTMFVGEAPTDREF